MPSATRRVVGGASPAKWDVTSKARYVTRAVGSVAQPGSMKLLEIGFPSIWIAKQPTPLAYAVAFTTVTAAAAAMMSLDTAAAELLFGGTRSESCRCSKVPPPIHDALPKPPPCRRRAVRKPAVSVIVRPSARVTDTVTSCAALLCVGAGMVRRIVPWPPPPTVVPSTRTTKAAWIRSSSAGEPASIVQES